jgi:flagellar protein FlbD
MVELTKLNGDKFYLNERWIEAVEALPDTTITLSSGNKFVVLEPMQEVLGKILKWQVRMHEALEGTKKPRGRK